MTEILESEIWKALDDLHDEYQKNFRQPGEFSINDYMERCNITHKQAYDILKVALKDKRVTRRRGRDIDNSGHPCDWYKLT